ncbi:MAG: glucosyltransferase domain-containing protein [Succinivibrio sp.]
MLPHPPSGADNFFTDVQSNLKSFFSKLSLFLNREFSAKKTFFLLAVLYSLALFSILRENISYRDDIGRTAYGFSGWLDFSRYSTEYLSQMIHAGSYISDISPIPQIIAIIELSLAAIYLLKGITGKRSYTLWQLVATIPLALNPYFLECLSFKFDAPYMALSILVAVIPVLFIKHISYFFTSVLVSTVIICTSYQASIGILPMSTVFTLLALYTKGESLSRIFKTAFVFALAFLSGAIIFKTLILQPTFRDYVTVDIAPLEILPKVFVKNMTIYYSELFSNSGFIGTSSTLKKTIIIASAVMLIVSICHSKNNKLLSFLFAALTFGLGALLTFGFYACLEKPLFIPRAYYGIGAFVACVFIFAVSYKDFYIAKICSVILGWSLIVMASAYGNALVAQRNWENFRVEEVVHDLATIDSKGQTLKFKVEGNCGYAPVLRNLTGKFPIFKKLIPQTFGQDFWFWNEPKLSMAYGINELIYDNDIRVYGEPSLVKESRYHTIKLFENNLIIELK